MRLRRIDPLGVAIRLARELEPRFGAALSWRRASAGGDRSLRLVEQLVGPGDTVVDAGANFGMFTWRLSRLVGPLGRVHAFEPAPEALQELRRLAARSDNVSVHAVALSDRTGSAELHVPFDGRGRVLSPLARLDAPPCDAIHWEARPVEARRLDDLLGAGARVDFLKCDVEGHEHAVLEGARRTLERDRPPILIEIEARHRRDDPSVTIDFLLALGYRGWAVGTQLVPVSEFSFARDQSGAPGPGYVHDFVFVPSGASAVEPAT